MIKLKKLRIPSILKNNSAIWTAEYENARASSGQPSDTQKYRYRHPDIKTTLRDETNRKCAYCESIISDVSAEIEHIRPKSKRPDLYVEWSNLTYVCKKCNISKSDYYDEVAPLINPYIDDPSEHIFFYGPAVLDDTDMGFRTIETLELSRIELVEAKEKCINAVNRLLRTYKNTSDGSTKEVLRKVMIRHADKSSEFSAMVRAYLEARGIPL